VRNAGMVFVADDLAGWLIGLLADAGRKKLTGLVLGSEQERALRSAATAAVQRTAAELQPGDAKRAEQLAMVVSQVFGEPVPGEPLAGHATVLEALQAGIAGQLAVLDDASLTDTGQSSAEILGNPGAVMAAKLTGYLLREIAGRGSRGGPLAPLADQLNHDETHLRGQRIEAELGQLTGELQEALSSMVRIHAAAPVALAQLPAMTAGFTGREADLALLGELLDPWGNEGPVLVSAVAGLPGVGKTALAVQAAYAALRKGWYRGGVVFIDLHGYDDQLVEPGQALDALLRALGVGGDHIPASLDERVTLYRSVLAEISDPVLVVADNASSEAQVGPLLPGIGSHKMLVTSRHTLAGLKDARLVDVRILDKDSSVDLLDAALRTARPGDDRIARDPRAATRLAMLCDGLPLALQIAAALLKADPLFEANELADELAEEHLRLKRLRYDDGSGPGGFSVAAAFELSFRKLDKDHARLFRLLPVNTGPDISVASAAALADMHVGEVRHVLAGLVRAHLVEAAPSASRRWRMHDLIRLYAAQLPDDPAGPASREQARDRLLRYYAHMTDAAVTHLVGPSIIRESEGFTGRDDALDWLDAERPNLIAAAGVTSDLAYYLLAFGLCGALVEYLSWRRYIDDWIAIATIGLRAARNLNDRSKEAVALNLLGLALQGTRQFDDAAKAHRAAAAIFRETGDRHQEGRAMHNLGMALDELHLFGEAIVAYQQDLEICRESGDLNLVARASRLTLLASVFARKIG
jgi:tetratricopeptide (TPR) repeat protein